MAGKIKFVKRGGAVAEVIPADDLVMSEDFRIVRANQLDNPLQIEVSYMDKDGDYAVGVQYARRLTVENKQVTQISLPIVFYKDFAKQLAEVLLYTAWVSSSTVPLKLPPKYSRLEPTDIIQVVADDFTFTLRLEHQSSADDGETFLTAFEDVATYTNNAEGTPLPVPPGFVQVRILSLAYYMDIHLLRDQDDDEGFYIAAGGYDEAWRGAQIYRSLDNGSSYSALPGGLLETQVTAGVTMSTLGDFNDDNGFDESNTVDVFIMAGELSSTSELNVLAGVNAILIGNEILQFKNAALNSDGNYTLYGLLRGRRGTEPFMGTHVTGERVVLLTTSAVIHRTDSSSLLSVSNLYKVVTLGTPLDRAPARSFVNNGVSKKPYSVVQLAAGVDASGNAKINWVRRTRIGGEWRDYADAALGETSESYVVEIWDSSFTVLKRTFTPAVQTQDYTAAQMVTDFGVAQSTIYVRVYQVSSVIGRGYVNQQNLKLFTQYATWDSAKKASNISLSGGNLIASNSGAGDGSVLSDIGVSSGKYYWEVTIGSVSTVWIGIASVLANTALSLGADIYGWGYRGGASPAAITNNNSSPAYGANYTTGDIISVLLDMDAGTLVFWKNGVAQGTAATGLTGTYYAAAGKNGTLGVTLNAGVTAFTYAVPVGYEAGLHT